MDHDIIGVSQNVQRIRDLIDQVADTGLNVIVSGETGVGKELVVHQLFRKSNRIAKPFVKVNCAALPDTLLESEMFGYERGAFTGAYRTRRGKFEQANGGLLFLDEIGDMSLPLQSKLLHVLQGGDFTPLGSEKQLKTDVWIIAATNRVLEQEIANGNFRNDLYFRLSNIRIFIEPLRKRPEDIPVLIDFFLERFAAEFNGGAMRGLSRSTMEKLTAYAWPGNIRELQNVLKRIVLLGESEESIDSMLVDPAYQRSNPAADPEAATRSHLLPYLMGNGAGVDLGALALKEIRKQAANEVERKLIAHVLEKTGWNRSKASRILKVSYKTLLQKIEELAIAPPPELA